MTYQKPTGVFVRLQDGELSEQQRANFIANMDCGEVAETALLAIGTLTYSGELPRTGTIAWFAKDREPSLASYCPALFKVGDSVPVTSLPDAEAQIAARDAEIARLNEELSVYRAGMPELIAKEVAVLRAEIKERDEKIEQDNAALAKLSEQLEDAGAQKVINLLAELVGVTQWEAGDGTEEWDGDVQLTLQNILEEAGIFHKDKGFSTHLEAEENSLLFPQKMTPDIEKALGLICFRIIPYANAFRAGGEDIKNHAEEEQAAIIFKVLRKVLAGMAFGAAFKEMHKEAYEAQESTKKGGAA